MSPSSSEKIFTVITTFRNDAYEIRYNKEGLVHILEYADMRSVHPRYRELNDLPLELQAQIERIVNNNL